MSSFLREYTNDFIAGLLAGTSGVLVSFPMDTIKVRQQTNLASKISVTRCSLNILKHEGVKGFYRGMAYPLASVGFLNSIFFGVYGNSMRHLQALTGSTQPSYTNMMICSAFAGIIQGFPACPIELIKVRLQAQSGLQLDKSERYKGPADCTRKIYKMYGTRGLFKGLSPTLFREGSGFLVYIATYEYICQSLRFPGEKDCNLTIRLFAGGFAGIFSWLNLPFDTIKSRMQADDFERPKYRGMWHCIRVLYDEHGQRVFWRGLPVTCIRSFPLNAVTLAVYSMTMKQLTDE